MLSLTPIKNVHAIGDRANAIVLDAFEAALKDVNVTALRPRLEHAQIMTRKDMERLGKLGGMASLLRAAVEGADLSAFQSSQASSRHTRRFNVTRRSPEGYSKDPNRISDMWYAEDRLVCTALILAFFSSIRCANHARRRVRSEFEASTLSDP